MEKRTASEPGFTDFHGEKTLFGACIDAFPLQSRLVRPSNRSKTRRSLSPQVNTARAFQPRPTSKSSENSCKFLALSLHTSKSTLQVWHRKCLDPRFRKPLDTGLSHSHHKPMFPLTHNLLEYWRIAAAEPTNKANLIRKITSLTKLSNYLIHETLFRSQNDHIPSIYA